MKRIILFLVAGFLSGTSFAANTFEGFYGQIAVGYESFKANSSNTSETFSIYPGLQVPLQTDVSTGSGFTQNLGLGYTSKLTEKFFLGIGVDYNPIASNSTNYNFYAPTLGPGAAQNSYKKTNTYNIFVTPGYAVTSDGLAYLKAGFSSTQIKLTAGTGSVAPGEVNAYSLNGYILGLGYKQFIANNLYGFLEGNYNNYQSKTVSSTSAYYGGTSTSSGNLGLSSYNFLVGIGYKF